MATLQDMSTRLMAKFRNVPNVTQEDAEAWLTSALYQHGLKEFEQLPTEEEHLVIILAQAEGARDIAVMTAHYFSYTDNDEQVDKSMVSEQYRKLSDSLLKEYERRRAKLSTQSVRFKYAKRIDR